jgi:hypothetical protein
VGHTRDENTKFFYATAIIQHNKNTIMSLKDEAGVETFSHEEKDNLLWDSFRERLGTTKYSHMYFDLTSLMGRMDNLEDLDGPFTKEEIDLVIKEFQF